MGKQIVKYFLNKFLKKDKISDTDDLEEDEIDRARYVAAKEKRENFFKDYGIKNAKHQIRENYDRLRNHFSGDEIQLINDEMDFLENFTIVGANVKIFKLRELWLVVILAFCVVSLSSALYLELEDEFLLSTGILLFCDAYFIVEFFRRSIKLLKIYKLQKKLNAISA